MGTHMQYRHTRTHSVPGVTGVPDCVHDVPGGVSGVPDGVHGVPGGVPGMMVCLVGLVVCLLLRSAWWCTWCA